LRLSRCTGNGYRGAREDRAALIGDRAYNPGTGWRLRDYRSEQSSDET
jgi:hypothetical protein